MNSQLTFVPRWRGLDNTPVLTHFSPADTYCAQATVKDITMCVTNHKDREYSNRSLLLFGNGDGGGVPLLPMIERLKRMQSLSVSSVLPSKIEFGDPNVFFKNLETSSRDLVTWKGELYFELHRGTYTTQGATKRYNRKSEFLMREVEILAVLNYLIANTASNEFYPKSEVDRLWKLVLLNQFHDVLPGNLK